MEMGKEPLQKVGISGGGRCNVMHDPNKGAKAISCGYPRGEKELLGPYTKAFGPQETYEWFNSRTPLKIEEVVLPRAAMTPPLVPPERVICGL
jgi:predicted flavoprotein YhiN